MSRLRRLAGFFRRTPFHPQWLLGHRREPHKGLRGAGGRLLDIGSADAWLRQHVADDCEYVALDYPVTATDLYRTRPHVFGDASRLPFADSTFDTVACLEVIEHVRDPDAALREVCRVLKPGGRAYLSMPFLYPIHDFPHDYQRWTAPGWWRSAQAAGLTVRSLVCTTRPVTSAGVLACLAITGPLLSARLATQILLAVPAAVLVFAINVSAWLLAAFWPRWEGMTLGYMVELERP